MMKDSRAGDWLWEEWTGEEYGSFSDGSDLVYFTQGHVDVNNDIVMRALASALQRDGVCHSLSEGYLLARESEIVQGWAGILPDEMDFIVCNEDCETPYGDIVPKAIPCTWVELPS